MGKYLILISDHPASSLVIELNRYHVSDESNATMFPDTPMYVGTANGYNNQNNNTILLFTLYSHIIVSKIMHRQLCCGLS